jgi:hypothetical protein
MRYTMAMITLGANGMGLLLPVRFDHALGLVAKLSPSAPRGLMAGQELRLALSLDHHDAACAGFVLDFAGQGARVTGDAHGPSAALLAWALHAIAETLRCDLLEDDAPIAPAPAAHRVAAIAYLETYEAAVLAARRTNGDPDPDAFVRWLAREEHIALAGEAAFTELPLDDAEALYEQLLENDAVDDVFVSERELARLLTRFRAWSSKAR